MSHYTDSTVGALVQAVIDTLNDGDLGKGLNFISDDEPSPSNLDRPYVLVFPSNRRRVAGGIEGTNVSSYQGVNEWALVVNILVGIPKMGQTTSPLLYEVDDYIDNIILDHEDNPIGLDNLPDDIEWVSMVVTSAEYAEDAENQLVVDVLGVELEIVYNKLRENTPDGSR